MVPTAVHFNQAKFFSYTCLHYKPAKRLSEGQGVDSVHCFLKFQDRILLLAVMVKLIYIYLIFLEATKEISKAQLGMLVVLGSHDLG